jgi:hypothetical protein
MKETRMTQVHDQITLVTSGEFAASIPSMMGFCPQDSLIVVFARQGRVIVTTRVDLDATWSAILETVSQAAIHVEADTALIAVYATPTGNERPFQREISRLIKALQDLHVQVLEAIHIDAGLWQSYLPPNEHLGQLVDPGLDLFGSGTVRDRREDLAATYTRKSDEIPSPTAFKTAIESLSVDPLKRAEDAWVALNDLTSTELDSGDIENRRALLQLSCLDDRCRDYVIAKVANVDSPQSLIDAFTQAALASPHEALPKMAGAAAALLAAFRSSTIPASCLAELAGDDSLGQLVDRAIKTALPPWSYAEILRASLVETEKALHGAGDQQ